MLKRSVQLGLRFQVLTIDEKKNQETYSWAVICEK